mmetsp:Transcript_9327/g.20821  ORF Transcript_9327/g.20821 Transcript_9327/m.20821 type:complete len:122 (+) Transcript_9327:88-453(+)
MGPAGVPPPGAYETPKPLKNFSATIGLPKTSAIEDKPGPGAYDPIDHMIYPKPPSVGFTGGERAPPWDKVEDNEQQSWEYKGEFKPSGPAFTIQKRFKVREPEKCESHDLLYGPFPSIETS